MKKNGFTLVELLAVVSIISILLLLVAPKIVNQLNNSKEEVNDVTKKIIYSAAEKYIKDNNMNLEYDYCLSVEELQDKEYLSDTITDNKSGLDISKKSVVITPKDNSRYEYELTSECNTATGEDYRGYYADVDGDGTPDGVIYADLNKASESGAQYSNSNGAYTYPAKTNLNEYTISKNKHNGNFGEKEIIKLKKNKDNPRFYVMALEDFRTGSFEAGSGYTEGTYYWYKNASGKMSTYADDTKTDFGKGYENTGKMIGIWEKNGEGEGEGSYQGATQDDQDIWKHIKDKYNSKEKWYIPSRGELAAFGDYFTNKTDLETKLTTSNYNSLYGLSVWYWSSSQLSTYDAWYVDFSNGNMNSNYVNTTDYVRLGATF